MDVKNFLGTFLAPFYVILVKISCYRKLAAQVCNANKCATAMYAFEIALTGAPAIIQPLVY